MTSNEKYRVKRIGGHFTARYEIGLTTNARKPRSQIILWLAATVCAMLGLAGFFGGVRRSPFRFRQLPSFRFDNLSAPAFDDAFSDGLTDESAASISHLDGVRVAGRRSAYVFKGKRNDLRDIGSRLNVEAVVEGSVQRSGDRTHVTVELNRTRDGFTVWSQTYDGTTADWIQIESQIAGSIARALARKFSPDTPQPPATPKPTLSIWKRAISGTSETFRPNSRASICCSKRSRATPTMPWHGRAWRIR